MSVGFNVETIHYDNLKLITWDLSAKEKIVSLCDCVIKHYNL